MDIANLSSSLPAGFDRNRVLSAKLTAALYGKSLPHFRRLYRTGKVVKPIKIGSRALGWRYGDVIDDIASRVSSVEAA